MNKIFYWTVQLGYLLGLIISIQEGVWAYYILATSSVVCVVYHKQLWRLMNIIADWYADKCWEVQGKIKTKVMKTIKK